MKALQCSWPFPFLHGLNIFEVHSYPLTSHNVTQVFHLKGPKKTLGIFHKQLMVLKELQSFIDML